MTPEHDRVAFRMMEIDFEWDGLTRTLTCKPRGTSRALRELVQGLIASESGAGVPAAMAVRRAGERLAQRVTGVRIVEARE